MNPETVADSRCCRCGGTLDENQQCLACLFQAAFDDATVEQLSTTCFGDYEIARRDDGSLWELGRGSMGVTYRAVDKVLRRSVALKVINTAAISGDNTMVRERFLREARATAALHHTNVAGVFQFGAIPEEESAYYAMELLEGETLEALVRRDGPLKLDAAMEVAVQVTRALTAAAAQGLVHRDLKPGNIMVTKTDHDLLVKVIDFGLAKAAFSAAGEADLTHGGFVGTPAFASPEQFAGAPADARSDIYSLGATLWFALTGEAPFGGRTGEEIRRLQTQLPLPVEKLRAHKVRPPVIQLLRRMLSPDPAERPASARQLLDLLEQCRERLGLAPRRTAQSPWVRRRRNFLIGAAVAVLVGAVFVMAVFVRPGATAAIERSVAVVPFRDNSPAGDQEYLGVGIAEQVTYALAHISELRVMPSSSAFAFRKREELDPREIGRRLGVAYVLDGTVHRNDGKTRVTTSLIETATGYQVWAENYDSAEQDVFSLQNDIAKRVARALRAKLQPAEHERLAQPPTQNEQAYDLYLRGRFLLSRRTPESVTTARQLFGQAVAIDPEFALGHTGVAEAYIQLGKIGVISGDAAAAAARPEIASALEIDPELADAYVARGIVLNDFEWNWPAAEADYRRAIELEPNNASAHHWLARHQAQLGNFDEALRLIERARELDPAAPMMRVTGAKILIAARRNAEAVAPCEQVLTLEPQFASAFSLLAQARTNMGDHAGGIKAARRYVELSGGTGWAQLELAYAHAVAGERAAAKQIMARVQEHQLPFSPYDMGTIHGALGEPEEAIRWMEKAIEERSVDVIWIRVDPRVDWVRDHPGFQQVIARLVPRS